MKTFFLFSDLKSQQFVTQNHMIQTLSFLICYTPNSPSLTHRTSQQWVGYMCARQGDTCDKS